ncbi:hypothetical protein CVT24_001303 [Panaeolus cyanescens]|uniref:Uncharacterized protein n=1 Tax=Panaeolus cyanescens TaxID=181874 RepID=A0A409YG50_9AGAR|nr:hypothetical protein CVT24_001303 [Panaeolus cyanescens]
MDSTKGDKSPPNSPRHTRDSIRRLLTTTRRKLRDKAREAPQEPLDGGNIPPSGRDLGGQSLRHRQDLISPDPMTRIEIKTEETEDWLPNTPAGGYTIPSGSTLGVPNAIHGPQAGLDDKGVMRLRQTPDGDTGTLNRSRAFQTASNGENESNLPSNEDPPGAPIRNRPRSKKPKKARANRPHPYNGTQASTSTSNTPSTAQQSSAVSRSLDIGFISNSETKGRRQLMAIAQRLRRDPAYADSIGHLNCTFSNGGYISTSPILGGERSSSVLPISPSTATLNTLLSLRNVHTVTFNNLGDITPEDEDSSWDSTPPGVFSKENFLHRYLSIKSKKIQSLDTRIRLNVSVLVLKAYGGVPLSSILLSPTLRSLTLERCTIRRYTMPMKSRVAEGFKLNKFVSICTTGIPRELLKGCSNLKEGDIHIDEDSTFQ